MSQAQAQLQRQRRDFIEIAPWGFRRWGIRRMDFEMRWDEIPAVVAYKVDLWTTDRIDISFQRSPPGMDWYTVDEEMLGYDELLVELQRRLPGIRRLEDWWPEVVFPAFETRLTWLYRRPTLSW